MRTIAVFLLVVGALSALGFARHEQRVREQDQLATIASDLAGRKIGVRCPGFLSSLVDTRGEAGRVRFDAAWAAHTLAHEAFHLRGFQDEGVTECYALQNTAFVAERLGVPAPQAEKLQQWIYVRGYPNEPEEYHSAQCYSGGPLDLRPNVAKFP